MKDENPGIRDVSNYRDYSINFDEINTLEDVLILLKSLKITFNFDPSNVPEEFKEMFESNRLTELNKPQLLLGFDSDPEQN